MKILIAMLGFLLLAGCGHASPPQTQQPADAASVVQKALAGSGMTLDAEMQAPKGYHGFVGKYQGKPVPVYLLPDGKHIMVGQLIDLEGHDLTSPALQQAAVSGLDEADWKALGKATWVREGPADAERVVYVFVDTRCPFCHRLWQLQQPFIDKGHVRVRNIMVAVISPDSLPEGAEVLDADDPTKAWRENERNYGHNPKPDPDAGSASSRARIRANNQLMMKLGFHGTPAIIYKDADGRIHSVNGVPQDPDILRRIFEG